MGIPRYLAMTAAELSANPPAQHTAWMACHFSSYHSGLSNLPPSLPANSLLILDDSIPMENHSKETVKEGLIKCLDRFSCAGVLLDFQRPDSGKLQELAASLAERLPCPVAVSHLYAKELACPVFLPPCPLHSPLRDHLAPWADRDIWLETALDRQALTLTEDGCTFSPASGIPETGFPDETLNCHYTIETGEKFAKFTLWRTPEDLESLLAEAEALGVTHAVGLWQELGR